MFDGLYTDGLVVTPYIDHAKTNLEWSISAGPSTQYSPNILSELSFDDMKTKGWGLSLSYLKKLNNKWAFNIEADLLKSKISSGDVQDSDYAEDNRQAEFSRSYSDAKGDGADRRTISTGFKYRWFGNKGHYASVLIGKQIYDFDIRMRNGTQVIPATFPIPGLSSTYETETDSIFIALGSEHVFDWGTVGLRLERHDVSYDAKANWNLREDLAHPVSFAHTAEGTADVIVLGYSYTINKSWDVFANLSRRTMSLNDGYDHVFANDGRSTVVRLNNVDMTTSAVNAGVRYLF